MTKENIRKLLLAIIFVLILIVIALFIGKFTYSYLGPAPTDELTGTGEVTPSGDTIIFSKGNDLSLSASTDNFHTGSGNLTDTTNPQVRLIASSDTNNASTTYFAGIRIYENTYTYSSGTTADVILTVKDESGENITTSSDNSLSYVTVTDASGTSISGFDITGKTGAFNIVAEHPISTTSSTTGTTQTWTFTITFVNYTYDQSINENATLDMEVILQKDEILPPTLAEVCSGKSMAECIATQLYTTDGENGLYLHDGAGTYTNSDQEAGDNSYRFSGANPNNYVCFGSTESPCPVENLYRIIGVFNDQIKLLKTAFYGNYAWDVDGDSTWDESTKPDIYTTLNTTYYNTIPAEWQNLIAESTWQVGGMDYSETNTAKQYYDVEVGIGQSGYVETMKIGLMYVSDYGYGASPENWQTSLYHYNNDTNLLNNWMLGGIGDWTISRVDYQEPYFAHYISFEHTDGSAGRVYFSNAYYGSSVRPVFYLNSNVEYNGGTGTESDPFTLVV